MEAFHPSRIDCLNIVLILASLLLAFLIPFHLFLFAYAVLGPVHYLTEINWLRDRQFFVKDKKWIWLYVAFACVISLPVIFHLPVINSLYQYPVFNKIVIRINGHSDILLLGSLLFAIGLTYLRKWQHTLFFLIVCLFASHFITKYILQSYILIGIFLPTLIHVYIFTLLFMLLGTINNKSTPAFIALLLFILSPLIIFASNIHPSLYETSDTIVTTTRNFRFVTYLTESFDKLSHNTVVPLKNGGIKIQVFIAFCYTYHYLNWFSKMRVIGWAKTLTTQNIFLLISVWIATLILFWIDYEIAYLAIFFLAILHIILEFPLNIISVKEIWLKTRRAKAHS